MCRIERTPEHEERPRRRGLRLDRFDYVSPGAYFVTLCTHRRVCCLGTIRSASWNPNELGEAAQRTWNEIPEHFASVRLDAFIVMPNHVHGVIVMTSPSTLTSPQTSGPAPRSLGAVVGSFKAASSRRINALRGTPGAPVWQRGFFDHVVRTEAALLRIRQYILANPARWVDDPENPERRPGAPSETW